MKNKKVLVEKFYKLKRDTAPLTYMLASRNSARYPLLWFDEEKGINRPLRYARNQKSPFEDDHPQRDMVFEEINRERDAAQELEYVESGLEAQILAKNLEFDKLVSVCRVLMGANVDKMSSIELRRDILIYAKQNPEDFINTLNDPMLEMQDTVYRFFDKAYLVFKNSSKDVYFNLPKNKKKLLTVPFGEDPYFIVASHFQSDDGIELYKLLKKRLDSDKK